jgi:hypothetical protein
MPIAKNDLLAEVARSELQLDSVEANFWRLMRLENPEKWQLSPEGDDGGGFWVVAMHGNEALWYNDIEDGFNWSPYQQRGTIDEYWCEQDSLDIALRRKLRSISK